MGGALRSWAICWSSVATRKKAIESLARAWQTWQISLITVGQRARLIAEEAIAVRSAGDQGSSRG